MNLQQRQILRANLLRQLECIRRGMTLEQLNEGARLGHFNITSEELESNLDWLVRKGYATEARSQQCEFTQIWKITGAGILFLDD